MNPANKAAMTTAVAAVGRAASDLEAGDANSEHLDALRIGCQLTTIMIDSTTVTQSEVDQAVKRETTRQTS